MVGTVARRQETCRVDGMLSCSQATRSQAMSRELLDEALEQSARRSVSPLRLGERKLVFDPDARKGMPMEKKRKTRADKGFVRLRDRDLKSLSWIAEQYAVCLDQLQRLLGREAGRGAKEEDFISENAARLVVARWKRARLVEYRKFTVEDPAWVWLTAHGLQELGLGYKAYEPSVSKLEHFFMVNEVRLMLEEEQPSGRWRSERELRAGVSYIKGDAPAHMVDGTWTTGEGTAGIEVELSPKKPAELQRILRELTATYPQVWYYVTDATRSGVLAARKQFDEITARSILVLTHPQWVEDEDDESA